MIGLVDSAALARIPLEIFEKLGTRFVELQLAAARDEILLVGRGVPIEQRAPLRRRRLRARSDDAAVLLRLFCFDDAVPADDIARVLGAVVTGALLGAGVLVRHPTRGVIALLTLTPLDHILVLGDRLAHAGEAVMGVGATTIALCRASVPTAPLDQALDMGCGAGACALYLAKHVRRSIGVDINPRAAILGRINAALNRIDNVEFRVGDLFAPVADERFDLVVSQPPFVARPEGATEATYMFGGTRGDELAVRLLRELPPLLAEHGRAVVVMEWPRFDDQPVTALARAALDRPDLSVLSLEVRDASADEIAASYASAEHPTLDESYAASARRFREHLARLGVRAVTQTLIVVGDGGFTARVPLSSPRITHLSGARIEARVAAERLLVGDRRAFLRARLRLAPGIQIDRVWGAKGAPARFTIDHPSDPLVATTDLNAPTHELLREIDRADDVGTAIAWVAARHRLPKDKTLSTLVPIAENALRQGVLVPV